MSGIIKAVGRVFKKIVKVVKKIAIPALAIGAIVLTGGAALGVLPAVGSVIGGLGLSAGVTAALTGAVTMAGIGGGIGLVTGGWEGMKKGALIGAATGGLMGATGLAFGAAAGGAGAAGTAGTLAMDAGTAALTGTGTAAAGAATTAATSGAGLLGGFTLPAAASVAAPVANVAVGTTVAAGGGLLSKGLMAAPLLSSALQGIGGGMSAKAAAQDREAERAQIAANYDVSGGLLAQNKGTPNVPAGQGGDAFSNINGWVYDERLKRLVRRNG